MAPGFGRASYHSATDDEALDAFKLLGSTEGILPALEPAHALAYVMRRGGPGMILVGLSGRGDKDVATVSSISSMGDVT